MKVWVQVNSSEPTKISIEGSKDLDDFCHAIKKALPEFSKVGVNNIVIKSHEDIKLARDVLISNLHGVTFETALRAEIPIGSRSVEELIAAVDELKICTDQNQMAASSFSKSSPPTAFGFGSLPTTFQFDPTDNLKVHEALVPSETEIDNCSCHMPFIGENPTLLWYGDDGHDGVRARLTCDTFYGLKFNGTTTLKTHNCARGIATDASHPDFLWIKDRLVLGIVEVKGGNSSPLPGLRQAAITGTNVSMGLLSKGIDAVDCIVPICGTTGMLIQFGAIFILQPSFPAFICISKVLDLGDRLERRRAEAYLEKAKNWTEKMAEKMAQLARGSNGRNKQLEKLMVLDRSKYFVKELDEKTISRGLGLLSDETNLISKIGRGMEHMGRVLNLLFSVPELRTHVVFPLTLRSPDDDKTRGTTRQNWMLIYKNLVSESEGYRIGTPNRYQVPLVYNAFVTELRRLIVLVHTVGVIHCDLYPSNIMWRMNIEDESVNIRLIDWDAAHCLDENYFSPLVKEALANHNPTRSSEFGTQHDIMYIDVLDRSCHEDEEEDWTNLASNEKWKIDASFLKLFNLHT